MSFSAGIKSEILDNKPLRTRFKKAQAYGLFAFSKSFCEASVEIATENIGTAKLFVWFLQDFLGRYTQVCQNEKAQNGKTVYTVKLIGRRERERLLEYFGHTGDGLNMDILPTQEHAHAFLSGAYLACGNITDPQKSYHIEYVVRNERLCGELKSLMDSCLPGARSTTRRGSSVIYYKEYAQIEDLLTMIGAPKSCLAMIDIEMIKSVRNGANRATNCETANIDKLVNAATAQLEDINLVLETVGEAGLPESLRAAANLRLENPDSSLRELSELSLTGISRSGIHHRLDKLSRMAAVIRSEEAK